MEQSHTEPSFIFYQDNSALGLFNTGKLFHDSSTDVCESPALPSLVAGSVHVGEASLAQDMPDAHPQDQSLLVDYRLLSAAIVYQQSWGGTVAMDFSTNNGQVLKRSLAMLNNLPVMYDHHTSVKEWLGLIEHTEWTTAINAHPVAGINGRLNLDIDPDSTHETRRIIRGVEKGVLNSFSVSVSFDYERSHPEMDEDKFFRNMGKKALDGELIRLMVTNIKRYYEGSLVYAGADPLAKRSFSSQPGLGLSANGGEYAQLCSFSNQAGWEFTHKVQIMGTTFTQEPVEDVMLPAESTDSTLHVDDPTEDTPAEETPAGDATTEALEGTVQRYAALLTRYAALQDQQHTASELLEAEQKVSSELVAERNALIAELEVKSTELQEYMTLSESTRQELDAYKESVKPLLETAATIEQKFRQDGVNIYHQYTLTFKSPVSDEVKQKRIDAILHTMSLHDVMDSVEMWQGEFQAAFPQGRESHETETTHTENDGSQRVAYQNDLAVIDESLM